jgi:NADP-dependent 3-hydroxy acid dehydrogenase YdfG
MTRTSPGCPPETAVVTGASSGIGRAIAVRLADVCTRVCLLGRDRGRLAGTADAVASLSRAEALVYPLDLTADHDIARLARWVGAELGGLDVLVHSAGLIRHGAVARAPVQDLDAHYALNVRAPYLLTQALLPHLALRRGQIVFVNSSAGVAARGGVGQYAATKHALKALADSLRDEVNPLGVRVLSIYPGRTATPMQAHVHASEGRGYRPERLLQPADIAEMLLHALLLPRSAEVTDLHLRPLSAPDAAVSEPRDPVLAFSAERGTRNEA